MRARSISISRQIQMAESIDWQAVYSENFSRVYYYFCYRLGDRNLAQDLTATTFEKAWRGRARYRQEAGAITSWLFGIARRVAVAYFRGLRPEVALDEIEHLPSGESTEEAVQRLRDFERLAKLLRKLPERERELIALKYGAELTNREIARQTGLSESNVGTILHRTVSWLRAEWEKTL